MKTKTFTLLSKPTLVLALLFASLSQVAQSGLSNMSFEAWSTNAFGNAPTGWLGFNISKQTTGAQQGSNYVRISNTNVSQGTLLLGSASSFTTSIKGGAPFTQMPTSLNGFFKTSGLAAGDTMGITAYSTKAGTLVALGMFTLTGNTAAWTSFSMPFMPFGSGPSDTIYIVASSGNIFGGDDNSVGSALDLDNLSLVSNTVATGIDQRSVGSPFLVYPNPASSELNILSKDERADKVIIHSMDGRLIGEARIENETTRLDLQQYANGVYTYSIVDKSGAALLSSRFVVAR